MAKRNQSNKVKVEALTGASLIGAEGTDKAPPPAPKVVVSPARKGTLMPDCRSFNLDRHCDAGKKSVNCCGPDCRQYISKPKPVAALLIAQLTKK